MKGKIEEEYYLNLMPECIIFSVGKSKQHFEAQKPH